MKTYVIITGAVFGLLTLAHVWRVVEEGPRVLDVWWILVTIAAGAFCVWACRLVWASRRT